MAVSYVSKPYKSDPYVLPFDLNLFAKVMQYKQTKYDEHAGQIQQEIDNFANLDVMKGQDKDYLNNKINNIVNGINSMGGVDLSDDNITNQIESHGADIYGDEKISTAVASTKMVRGLTNGYNSMKLNPKTAKMYSPVNEAYDMKSVNAWLSDGQLGSSYQGPSSPSPYVNYRDNQIKAFNNLKANMREKVTDHGLVYVTETNEEITPERVMQMASDLLVPEERQQMKKDGWYLYKDANPNDIVQKSLDQNNQKLARARGLMENYRANANAATADPIAKQNYLNLLSQQKAEVDGLSKTSSEIAKNGAKKFQENPEEYMYYVYSNDYNRGLAERFSYSRNSTKITPNTAEMFKERQKQEHDQFEDNLDFQKHKFATEEERKAIEMGLKYYRDPFSGLMKAVGYGLGFTDPNVNIADTSLYTVNEDTYKTENANLEADKQKLFGDWLSGAIRKDPSLTNILSSTQTGTGMQFQLKGVKGLEYVDGKPGFSLKDLNIDLNSPNTKKWMLQNGINDQQAKFLKDIYTNYNAMSEGKPVDLQKLPNGFSELVESYQLINEKIRANEEKTSSVNETANAQAGITTQDMAFYNDYSAKEAQYAQQEIAGRSGQKTFDPRLKDQLEDYLSANRSHFNQINGRAEHAASIKRQLYEQVANRPVYEQMLFSQNSPIVKSGQIQKLFLSILGSRGDVTGKMRGEAFSEKSIEPLKVGRSADGTESYDLVANVVGEKGTATPVTVKLTGQQAEQLGFYNDPYKNLNESVMLTARSGDLIVRGGSNLVAKVNIVKANDDRNSGSSYAQLLIATNNSSNPYIYVDVPGAIGDTPSAAYAKIKEILANYGRLGGNLEQFQKDILNSNYK